MIEKAKKAFDKYLSNYDKNVKEIRYKYHHCYEVEKLMGLLSQKLNLSKEEQEVARLIGLLHDIGRFEQVRKFGKCCDVSTGIDHADESCDYLFTNNHIRDFINDNKYDDIIKDAIKNHNKYEIDKNVKGKNLLFSKMIRDMDKVDIFRVLSEEYTQDYNKDEICDYARKTFDSRETLKSFKNATKSDDALLHTALVFDINFKDSFLMLKNSKYLDSYFNTFNVSSNSVEEYEKLKKDVYSFVEEKITC